MSYTVKHIGEGKFEATLDESGEIKNVGKNICGMVRYTYFPDFTLPPVGWKVTRKKLMEDYHPKVMKDIASGELKPGKHEFDNGNSFIEWKKPKKK